MSVAQNYPSLQTRIGSLSDNMFISYTNELRKNKLFCLEDDSCIMRFGTFSENSCKIIQSKPDFKLMWWYSRADGLWENPWSELHSYLVAKGIWILDWMTLKSLGGNASVKEIHLIESSERTYVGLLRKKWKTFSKGIIWCIFVVILDVNVPNSTSAFKHWMNFIDRNRLHLLTCICIINMVSELHYTCTRLLIFEICHELFQCYSMAFLQQSRQRLKIKHKFTLCSCTLRLWLIISMGSILPFLGKTTRKCFSFDKQEAVRTSISFVLTQTYGESDNLLHLFHNNGPYSCFSIY